MRTRDAHRERFLLHARPPLRCYFCRKRVTLKELHIHHVDENHANNAVSNLRACHEDCHLAHHYRSTRIRAQCKHQVFTRLWNAGISLDLLGQWLGRDRHGVCTYAASLRQRGYELTDRRVLRRYNAYRRNLSLADIYEKGLVSNEH